MPLIQDGHDDLSHIDAQPSRTDLDAARAALHAELAAAADADTASSLHPSIPAQDYAPAFSPLLAAAHEAIAATGRPRGDGEGIDLGRYEEPDAPADSADAAQWRDALKTAYTSQSYLTQRTLNLNLLEKYGKNAWLIGNAQLEDEVRVVEQQLRQARDEGFATEDGRRRRQEQVNGELEALQASWQGSLGRAIEAEVAGAALQQQILDARRSGAGA